MNKCGEQRGPSVTMPNPLARLCRAPISFRNSAFLNIVTALSDAMTAQESIKSGDDADAVRWIDNAMTQLKAARKMLVRIK